MMNLEAHMQAHHDEKLFRSNLAAVASISVEREYVLPGRCVEPCYPPASLYTNVGCYACCQ